MKVVYDAAISGFAKAQINWPSDTFKLVLVTAGYVFDATHTNLSQVPSGDRLATTAALTGKSVLSTGWCLADQTAFPTVSGAQAVAYICFKDTGTESTSTLIVFDNEADPLPITPNSNNITVTIPSTGLFKP